VANKKAGAGEALPQPKGGRQMLRAGINLNLGRVYLTRGVNDLAAESLEFAKFVTDAIRRHARGDWGDLHPDDQQENERALLDGSRIVSSYGMGEKTKIWVITEADRSCTTVLFPDEY
jgi:hypothetical protein